MYNGFNEDESTVAVLIDMEKAYDSVWREGLLYKLFNMGIVGRVWHWIFAFLQDRKASCTLQDFKGPIFETNVGLPQGSVIAPLLFSLFVADIYKDIGSERVKYADDGTIWRKGKNILEIGKLMEDDVGKIFKWTSLWRMKLSIEKTEVCVFSKDKELLENNQLEIRINGKKIPYNPSPRLLGVQLDEGLTFSKHLDNLELKAEKTLSVLRRVSVTEKMSTRSMLQLYKALVIPQIEFAAPVWQNSTSVDTLNKVQRKGLSLCLGVSSTAALNSLEVEASVLPLELRREELYIREGGKIMSKDNSQTIKQMWNDWRDDFRGKKRHVSPFGVIDSQLQDMETNTGISIINVEPEFSFLEGLCPSKSKPEYWNRLGSSKSRNVTQQEESKVIIQSLVEMSNYNNLIVFTDGSCLGNPGPCGSGACIFVPNETEPVMLKRPVTNRGSILLGELIAIFMALEFAQSEHKKRQIHGITIFSDRQSAVGILTLGWAATSHKKAVEDIKLLISDLERSELEISIQWTPGHADIRGNCIADDLAKEAAEEAKSFPEESQILTGADFKTFARVSCCMKWQRSWDASDTGRHLYEYKPKVSLKSPTYMFMPFIEEKKVISQLRLGYTLNDYRHKIGLEESPNCTCGEIETVVHFICDCEEYEEERQKLLTQMFYLTGAQVISAEIFLSLKEEIFKEHRESLLMLLSEYITSTKRFLKK